MKKNWIALLALTMSLAFCAVGAGCNGSEDGSSSVAEGSSVQESVNSTSSEEGGASDSTEQGGSSDNTEQGGESGNEQGGSSGNEQVHTHTYTLLEEVPATYFETGMKAYYTCNGCSDKFVKEGDDYVVATDASLVLAVKTIAEETTPSTVDVNSPDRINTIVPEKVKQFDQTEPTYVKVNGADGQEVQAAYFSCTKEWNGIFDEDNNWGFVEFRIPVNANCGGVSFTYKLLDSNNEVCRSVMPEDKAYAMKSFIEYKYDGQYVNVSKDIIGDTCLIADGEWHTFEMECTQENVELILVKIYHFQGEMLVTNMQPLTPKHIHATTEMLAQEETCTQDGNMLYYTCDCGMFFADSDATIEIVENSWVLPAHHTMSKTLEYNEEYHYYACEKCEYEDKTAHVMEAVEGVACIGVDRTACECGYAVEAVVTDPVLNFVEESYGATVYSHEWGTYEAARVAPSATSLRYLLWNDNNNARALSTIVLPRMNFASLKTVSITVLFESFGWDQQYGLEADALTNISDTCIDWADHTGTLTFKMVEDTLQMTLRVNGKMVTKTITDANVINGKASAEFYVQAYFERYITLSGFTFGGVVAIPDDGRFASGYATVTDAQYDANGYMTSLTMDIPHDVEWSNNSPVLTQDYLNTLYAAGLRKISFNVASTTDTNNFIVVYNSVADYNAVAATFDIAQNAGDLKLSYVNLNNGGMTVATTLTINLSYQYDPQIIADEIGLTLANGVKIEKTAEGYTLSNMKGLDGGAKFSAEQVNAWIEKGYTTVTVKVAFTKVNDNDIVVGYTPATGFLTNGDGEFEWTIPLTANESINFWVQSGDTVSSGAFTITQVVLA